ncbi:hypothetical protein FF011L_36510 [Roseimaritima multifibrata]|uniref:CoA-binding domain-containing protein n=1 Tax=Roseimaritima multifibrata TaxID=1930274 RepID=A0A517MIZ3_9BACT|nr:CoA-binding protein [Roseimaritima multifibrata]QDS94869.1 hypothetical protein FF011L_36510 [Roseimaritima multifibrata]
MNSPQIFLAAKRYAVAGASTDRQKYGNKVFRALKESGRDVAPLNPKADQVEGITAFTAISDLPTLPESLSVVTPPIVSRQLTELAIELGVLNIWFQPGAEDAEASRLARSAGLNVIDDGSCLLVLLALEK